MKVFWNYTAYGDGNVYSTVEDLAQQHAVDRSFHMSGRLDLNQRPLRPERSALSKLSYAPRLVLVKRYKKYSTSHALFDQVDTRQDSTAD